MPRLYLAPLELQYMSAYMALQAQIMQLDAVEGALDLALMRASRRVDALARKKLGSPAVTTIGPGGITAGSTTLPLYSVLGVDEDAELIAYIDTGSSQEIIPIVPGGVTLTAQVAPYPGTVTLALPVTQSHVQGATVQVAYYEVVTAPSSGWEPYTTTILTQAAEVALAHAPVIGQSGAMLTRRVFVKHYPINQILKVEHAYPFSNDWGPVPSAGTLIEPKAGFYKLSLGAVVIPRGMIRTSYTAGLMSISPDVKEAVAYMLADELMLFFNPAGAQSVQMGKRNVRYTDGKSKTLWYQKAEEILQDGQYIRTV